MKICSRCYYNKETLKIVCFTNEYEGDYEKTPSKVDDFKKYPNLKNLKSTEYDYITLEYGILDDILTKSKNYYIDLATKTLMVEPLSDDEIEKPIESITTNERFERLEEENANLLLDSIEKDLRIEQLENDIADLLLNLGGE